MDSTTQVQIDLCAELAMLVALADGYSEPWDNVSLQCGSLCGDGLIELMSKCHDGHSISGDGCSAGCTI